MLCLRFIIFFASVNEVMMSWSLPSECKWCPSTAVQWLRQGWPNYTQLLQAALSACLTTDFWRYPFWVLAQSDSQVKRIEASRMCPKPSCKWILTNCKASQIKDHPKWKRKNCDGIVNLEAMCWDQTEALHKWRNEHGASQTTYSPWTSHPSMEASSVYFRDML